MGCSAGFASAPVSGKQLRAVAIQGSLSLALALGRAVQQAQHTKADPVAAAATAGNGKSVVRGAKLLLVTKLELMQAGISASCRLCTCADDLATLSGSQTAGDYCCWCCCRVTHYQHQH